MSSRRDFLRKSAAAAAGAALVPRTAAAEVSFDDPRPAPQAAPRAPLAAGDPVRIAVIGTGGMGTAHCEAFVRMARNGRENVLLDAICDVCEPRLEAAARRIAAAQGPEALSYTDYRAVLARPDLHGVLIAAPEHWHARMAEDAIKAGKDVYLEKPMTLNLKDALRLQTVAHANPQVVLQVGTQYVVTPSYQIAKRLIAEGAIGKPVWSQTSYCRNSKVGEWTYYEIDPRWEPGINLDWRAWCGPLGDAPWDPEVYARWRRYRKYSTGIIGDLLVHHMAPMIMAIEPGWPIRVVATGGHYVDKKMQNHDQVNITIEFEREHTMVVAGSTCNELGLERVIRGHKANLFVGGRTTVLRPERIYAEEIEEREIPAPQGQGNDQDNLRLNWLSCIRSREKAASDVDLGTKVMVIVDLATRSLWGGAAFEYDPVQKKARKV
jgi:predicted dehydrogenase